MPSTSKAQLLESNKTLRAENDVLSLALSDLANGAVKWFGVHSRAFSLGISRPKGAAGGLAIVHASGMARAAYFEQFAAVELATIAACVTGENNEHNRELLRRREVIEEAAAYIRDAQRAA